MQREKIIKLPFCGGMEMDVKITNHSDHASRLEQIQIEKKVHEEKVTKTPKYLLLATKTMMMLCACLMFLLSCSDDKKVNVTSLTTQELIKQGWDFFRHNNLNQAELYFTELTTRADSSLVGFYGLGWTYVKKTQFENARNEFSKFISRDTLNIYSTTSSEYIDVQAGFSVAYNALKAHSSAITASQRVPNTWIFRHDEKIESVDIRLIRADSQYSLSLFPAVLTTIRTIDPVFNADPNTVEGQLLMARKLESMIAARK